MKKIVLSLAVLATVALVSCNKGAANAESETATVAETEVVAMEETATAVAETAAVATDTAAVAAEPAAEAAPAK